MGAPTADPAPLSSAIRSNRRRLVSGCFNFGRPSDRKRSASAKTVVSQPEAIDGRLEGPVPEAIMGPAVVTSEPATAHLAPHALMAPTAARADLGRNGRNNGTKWAHLGPAGRPSDGGGAQSGDLLAADLFVCPCGAKT